MDAKSHKGKLLGGKEETDMLLFPFQIGGPATQNISQNEIGYSGDWQKAENVHRLCPGQIGGVCGGG